jgi:hypothetical protein
LLPAKLSRSLSRSPFFQKPVFSRQVKSEVCLSPEQLLSPSLSPQSSTYAASSNGGMASNNNVIISGNNIKFSPLLPQKWCKIYDANLQVNF